MILALTSQTLSIATNAPVLWNESTIRGMCIFLSFKSHEPCLSPGVEPDPGAEGRKEPHPAGADAPGGSGAQPLRQPGTRGHTWQRLHANLPLQAAFLLLLVVRDG